MLLDHLYAVDTIERVHRAGGKVKSFTSYCCVSIRSPI